MNFKQVSASFFLILISAAASAAQPIRLYVLDCGLIDVADVSVFSPGVHQGESKALVDTCYLIDHPKGRLLWDAGLPDELIDTPEGKVVFDVFKLRVRKTLASQLAELNIAPASIKYLGISHLHFDHIGNAQLFPRATLLMQKEEYEAGFGKDPSKYGLDPTTFPTLNKNPVKKLVGDYDVFGDGRVVIKRALGHTPGHQALYVRLPKSGNILLSGDLAHFTENWENRRVPSFNFDKERSLKTMRETAAFLKKNKAKLWIQHDLEQNAALKRSPSFYD